MRNSIDNRDGYARVGEKTAALILAKKSEIEAASIADLPKFKRQLKGLKHFLIGVEEVLKELDG